LLEQMKSEPLSRLPPYPREPGEFDNQLLDGAHRSERRRKRQLRHFPHLGVEHLGRATLSLGHRSEHQLAEEIGVAILTFTIPPPADVSMVRVASSVCNCCSRPCTCCPS
jgi:hypothetical protein